MQPIIYCAGPYRAPTREAMTLENAAAQVFDQLGANPHTLAKAYRHIPSGKRYSLEYSDGEQAELSPLNGKHIYVRLDLLADSNIWQRIN